VTSKNRATAQAEGPEALWQLNF